MPRLATLTLAAALTACAPTSQRPEVEPAAVAAERDLQERMAVERRDSDLRRVQQVAYRIATAAHPLCQDEMRGWAMPVAVRTKTDFSGLRDAAARLLGVGPDLDVVEVYDDSAGLKIGDKIHSIDDAFIPLLRDRGDVLRDHLHSATTPEVTIAVIRDGATSSRKIALVPSCVYRARVDWSEAAVNAYADGRGITITGGMLKMATDDNELAYVFGHELAHNLRRHIDAKAANSTAGMVLGVIVDSLLMAGGVSSGQSFGRFGQQAGAAINSQDFEAEADYVGLYVTARAGFDIGAAPDFWRKMAVDNPAAIRLARSHPTTPERFVAMAATVAEIRAKITAGSDLKPNERADQRPSQ